MSVDEATLRRRAGGENFPVASLLAPRRLRPHLLAIYGFARMVDDVGDDAPGNRRQLLDDIEMDLDRALAGLPADFVVTRAVASVRARDVPVQPLRDLIAANRQDQVVTRYATFDALRGYCRLSAVPIGRLVLGLVGEARPSVVALSDDVCTGLQLVEHWQDIGEDARRGRVYVPAEDLAAFGCDEADLFESTASPRLRTLVAFEVARARDLLSSAVPLVAALRGRPRVMVAGFAAGGLAALDAVESAGHDVLGSCTKPTRRRLVVHLAGVLGAARR